MKKSTALLLCAALLTSLLVSCGGTTREKEDVETWTFTDSCGREVELPVEVNRVIPSGPLAQMILYTVCPDKLLSWGSALTRVQKEYIDEKYFDLPVTGKFYGTGGTVNYEEIIALAPDVIIDMGQAMEDISTDMDEFQEQTGIPVIFILADMEHLAEAYDLLGQVTGDTEHTSECSAYIRETLAEAAEFSAQIPEDERRHVIYSQGEYGTEVMGVGSVHAEVLDYAAAVNAAVLGAVASDAAVEVSMEQIYLWDPEVVILSPEANYREIFDDPTWAGVKAVQTGQVYEAPYGPYNWMDRPPSVQRVLAVKWLGNLLYPEVFDYDMIAEAQEFYRLFFHYELTEEEARTLMENSTFRESL